MTKTQLIAKSKIRSVSLQEQAGATLQHLISRDRERALKDLKTESLFQPMQDPEGPYDLTLSVEENRLVFRISNDNGDAIPMLVLSLKPYARLIKDYFLIVESYEKALRDGGPSRLEAIDMGRRGLHNEGASLLMERLKGKIVMDADTARRLFTLICVLHAGSAQIWR
jgi:uncharacterized protein (UPF0262 family)